MKKLYYSPEWKIVYLTEDLIATSGDFIPDDFGSNDSSNDDIWDWD